MEAVSIERQVEGNISKFYLDTLEWLQLEEMVDKCEDFVRFYYGVKDLVNPNTHFTSLDNLGPSLLYIFLKTRGVLLILPDLLNLYGIKYHHFTTDLKKVIKIYPEFITRDKISIIKKYIRTILKSFNAQENIISHALTFFDHFYSLVQYAKEEVVAAVICALTTISFDLSEISMRFICNRAGIRQSSLYTSFTHKIFPYLGIPESFKLKSSFELVKTKIRKKTFLTEIKIRTTEEEIVELWRSDLSIDGVATVAEVSKEKVVKILEHSLGDYRNYIVRYDITQQEVDRACQLRKKGLSFREIVPRIHRPHKIVKKIIEENLEDHAKYKYIPRRDRIRYANLGAPKVYTSSEPAVQLYCDLLSKLKIERKDKNMLSKLGYLLLQNETRVKRNITKTGRYLSGINAYRVEKTLLGLVLALGFPQVPQYRIADLIGVSPTAIRANLANEKLKLDNVAIRLDLAIRERINLTSIYDYLKVITTLIRSGKNCSVEQVVLKKVISEAQQVKANVQSIAKLLRKEGLYRDEALILATAISISCPSIKRSVIKQIIAQTIKRKVKTDHIVLLEKKFVAKKIPTQNQFSLTDKLGELLEERETDVLCSKCGGFVSLQIYPHNKKMFACRQCVPKQKQ